METAPPPLPPPPEAGEKHVIAFYHISCIFNENLAQLGQVLKEIDLPQNFSCFTVGVLVNTP